MATPVVTQIIVGPAVIYYAAVGTTLPADSVGFGTAWGGAWYRAGFTQEGVTLTYEDEQIDHTVEEALTPVRRTRSSESAMIETVLAELTASYLSLAMGSGTTSTTAAAVGQVGKEELLAGGSIDVAEKAWGVEGRYTDASGNNFPLRFFIYKGTAKVNGGLEFGKAKENGTGIPLQINALADTSKSAGQQLFKMQRVTAAAVPA